MKESLFPIKAANTVIMYSNNQITLELPDLDDQNLMMQCWHLLSEWGSERVALSFMYKASQYLTSDWP